MTPQRAVAIGSLVVNAPVVVILISGLAFSARFFSGIMFFVVWFPTFALAWLYWAIATPRWRVWAMRREADPDATQVLAMKVGLTWPKGWVFEKTEIPTNDVSSEDELPNT